MTELELDALLKQLVLEPLSESNPRLEKKIWAEIRLRQQKQAASRSVFSYFFDPWLMPRAACAGLATAFLVGFILGSSDFTASPSSKTYGSLDLQVFSSQAPDLPSTLLTSRL